MPSVMHVHRGQPRWPSGLEFCRWPHARGHLIVALYVAAAADCEQSPSPAFAHAPPSRGVHAGPRVIGAVGPHAVPRAPKHPPGLAPGRGCPCVQAVPGLCLLHLLLGLALCRVQDSAAACSARQGAGRDPCSAASGRFEGRSSSMTALQGCHAEGSLEIATGCAAATSSPTPSPFPSYLPYLHPPQLQKLQV